MDDILLVYNKDMEPHLEHLQTRFMILGKHQLFANRSKYTFAHPKLEHLSHIISDHGVATDPEKTIAMLQWPVPNNITKLRGLGLISIIGNYLEVT